MKKIVLLLGLLVWGVTGFPFCHREAGVNAVLGDESYRLRFGQQPTTQTDEVTRIQTHLEHVENLLRQRDVADLPTELLNRRLRLLDLLHEYRLKGIFPHNTRFPKERKPCFIDEEGRICAVGYLVEQSAGRTVAESINKKWQYDYLSDMQDSVLDQWIAESGLTKAECAMIQPTYGGGYYTEREKPVPAGYGVPMALLGGASLAMMTMNTIHLAGGKRTPVVGVLGVVFGTGQVILGWGGFIDREFPTNNGLKTVSYINLAAGTTGIILSAFSLARKNPDAKTSWNVYPIPTDRTSIGMGFSYARRF